MSTINQSHAVRPNRHLAAAAAAVADEAAALVLALLRPSQVIAEVEQMHALQVEAARIEATQPERAAALRQRASSIGLR